MMLPTSCTCTAWRFLVSSLSYSVPQTKRKMAHTVAYNDGESIVLLWLELGDDEKKVHATTRILTIKILPDKTGFVCSCHSSHACWYLCLHAPCPSRRSSVTRHVYRSHSPFRSPFTLWGESEAGIGGSGVSTCPPPWFEILVWFRISACNVSTGTLIDYYVYRAPLQRHSSAPHETLLSTA